MRLRNWLAIWGVLVGATWPVAAVEPLTTRVTPRTAFAPVDVSIEAFIEPDERNRLIEFEADSGTFYTHSELQLEGEHSARVQQATFRMLPSGTYEMVVTLKGTNGERARQSRMVELW